MGIRVDEVGNIKRVWVIEPRYNGRGGSWRSFQQIRVYYHAFVGTAPHHVRLDLGVGSDSQVKVERQVAISSI